MPTVGSLKVLIEGDMRPYLVTVRQADEATKGFTRRIGRDVPDALRRANRVVDESAKSLAGLAAQAMSAYKGAVALAGAWGAGRLVRSLNDFARTAHEAEAGGTVFAKMLDRVGESVRRVRPELQDLADELRVAPQLIQSNAAELLRAGYTWSQIATIYRGAGASALLAGRSTAEGVEIATSALVSGLSTYLNQIGITQNLSTAQTQYARSLGKTAEALTDAERAQANTLMIQRATAQEVEDMPILLEGYGGAVSDLTRVWYDFRVALGTLVLPTVTAVLRALAALLAPIISIVQWLRQMRGPTREVADASIRAAQGAIDQAEAYRDQARELRDLLDRYEELSSITNRTADEQAALEEVMAKIRDHQPALAAGYDDLAAAIRDNIQPLNDYADALERMSEAELKLAEQRIRTELPALQARRDSLARDLDRVRGDYERQLQIAANAEEIALEARRLLDAWQSSIGREAPNIVEARLRELEEFLQRHFPDEYAPGRGIAGLFVRGLEESAGRRAQTAWRELGPAAERVRALEAEIQALDSSVAELQETLTAIGRVRQGLPAFPEEPATAPAVAPLSPLAAMAVERGWAATAARLKGLAEFEVAEFERKRQQERERWEQFNRDLQTLQDRLEARRRQGANMDIRLRYERQRQFVDNLRSLQDRLEERRRQGRLLDANLAWERRQEELKAEQELADRRRKLLGGITEDINRAYMSETDFFAWQLHQQVEEFRKAGIEEAVISRWAAAQWEMYWERAAASVREAVAEPRSELELLIDALKGAGQVDLAQALSELRTRAGAENLFVSRFAQAQIDEATRVFWNALTETGDVAEAAAEALDALRGAAEEAARPTFWKAIRDSIRGMLVRGSSIASDIVSAAQTAAPGGPQAMAGAALMALVSHSQTFQKLMAIMNVLLQAGADALGSLLEPLLPLVAVVATALLPIFQVLGTLLSTLLVPAFQLLFPVIKLVGLGFLWLGRGVAWVVNKIIDVINFVIRAYNTLLGWLTGKIKELKTIDLATFDEAIRELNDLTWESAKAKAEELAAVREVTEALRNVPQGFKIALRRFQVTIPAFGDGAIATEPMVAMVGDKGPEAIVPLNRGGAGTVIHVEISGPVYGMDDFDRKVQEAVARSARRAGMATYGLARG